MFVPHDGRLGWWVAGLCALLALGAYFYFVQVAQAPAPAPAAAPAAQEAASSTPALAAALSPLYSGVQWGAPAAESVTLGTTTLAGASVASQTIHAGMNPGGVFVPFQNYYDQKLKALGWSVANDLAAGGHVGGQTGYRKGGEVILVRFSIVYHTTPANAPSECPCDVTLSLFSGR